jgi:hypothetical protein
LAAEPAWGEGERPGPMRNSTIFPLFKTFSNWLELFWSKDGLSKFKKLQIKYRFEVNEIRNNFSYWNFPKLGIEFELKIKETLGFEFESNLMDFLFKPQDLMKFEQEAPVCTWMADQLMKRSLGFHICEFLDLLLEFDLNWLKIWLWFI